jgi:hypothetical protein
MSARSIDRLRLKIDDRSKSGAFSVQSFISSIMAVSWQQGEYFRLAMSGVRQ